MRSVSPEPTWPRYTSSPASLCAPTSRVPTAPVCRPAPATNPPTTMGHRRRTTDFDPFGRSPPGLIGRGRALDHAGSRWPATSGADMRRNRHHGVSPFWCCRCDIVPPYHSPSRPHWDHPVCDRPCHREHTAIAVQVFASQLRLPLMSFDQLTQSRLVVGGYAFARRPAFRPSSTAEQYRHQPPSPAADSSLVGERDDLFQSALRGSRNIRFSGHACPGWLGWQLFWNWVGRGVAGGVVSDLAGSCPALGRGELCRGCF